MSGIQQKERLSYNLSDIKQKQRLSYNLSSTQHKQIVSFNYVDEYGELGSNVS